MYDYRKMTIAERQELLRRRKLTGQPLHAPLHPDDGRVCFLITAACHEHQCVLSSQARRGEFESKILTALRAIPETNVTAWVVLPNHYHVVIDADMGSLRQTLARLHNGTSTQWNREDGTPGRRVWYRFRDDFLRDLDHYNQVLNYVHANPAKHGWVPKAIEWPTSSLRSCLETLGSDALRENWWRFPIAKDFGKGWDD